MICMASWFGGQECMKPYGHDGWHQSSLVSWQTRPALAQASSEVSGQQDQKARTASVVEDCEWCDAIDGDGVHYVESNGPYDDPNCTNGHEGDTDDE